MTTVATTPPGAEASGPEPESAFDRLRALNTEGRLAAEFPSLPSLLAEVAAGESGTADLARAGQFLARVAPDDILAAHPDTTVVSVAVAGHSTVGPVAGPLTAELARHGFALRLSLGDFDGYLRELQDPESHLHTAGTDLALVILDAQAVFDELPPVWRVEDLERAATGKLAQLAVLVERFAAREGAGTLVLNTLPLHRHHTHQLVDLKSRAALGVAWREFNAGLLKLAARHERVVVVDLDPLVAQGGSLNEPRMASYAKANLGEELLARYAREIGHLARTLKGRSKKVLVVDLDNTMWDGILGDDGADGIAAATTFRGEAFGNFQKIVRQIGSQGVLLAISSKNDQEPVLEVLRTHPDMQLRDTDFVRINANWNPKDANLRDIADRLNLGIDSFVFVDDSPFETGLVASSLPEVAVVRLDEEPALHIDKLLADGWFDVRELTAEDRERGALYRVEADRQDLLDSSGSMEEYLDKLGVKVQVAVVGDGDLARVAQLTLRTNQFNLTTERLQPAEVRARLDDPAHLVLSVRSGDRFGDNGVVGALFAHREGERLHIDNLILSCRVFARGIEQTTVASLLAHARDGLGVTEVTAAYRPTKKNHRVKDFWPSLGFEQTSETEEGELGFTHSLAALPEVPTYVHLDADLGGS
ncbi:HAD-IIIC family phosphatase [Streptacidiphilus jiangxiensis]|uniref:HAD-superfamily phosphatase, subfamily IIIC/FkbH-like domain-containing protein n=1 Tax=Streptacidiphilus jiangxiensis TaxID=235985 RepID=A0A1H7I9P9_STRJI|nr:HAD-IIIC family phosphatase [Streptacidiphilus jiangxiensis]SEK59271.1 HAD-superfamily phosphatase, subfamily IIIC/FkbH-like domain-containing protein [Streptacidiphilus jiangxiensis]